MNDDLLPNVKRPLRFLLNLVVPAFLVIFSITGCPAGDTLLTWHELTPLPDKVGLAGPFTGTHNGVLLVAGGANFPDKMPWDGGLKMWYETVFVLHTPDGAWEIAGKLPRPLGYGVSLSTEVGIVCLGGSDAERHYAEGFLLRWENGQLITSMLPAMPKPCANFCGALIGDTIYVAGGIETPDATNAMKTFWSLNLGQSPLAWQELKPWPGSPRMLAVAAVQDESFFIVSGADLSPGSDGKPVRQYLRDAYRYHPGQGWNRIANLPRAAVAAPSPALTAHKSGFMILSGDDGLHVNFQPRAAHPGFPKSTLTYDSITDAWQESPNAPAGHVTTTIVRWDGGFVLPSGEVRPGVRSPSVWIGRP